MDEIFGENNCRAFITRKKCSTKNYTKNTFGNISDYIMFYSKTAKYTWNRPYVPWEYDRMIEQYPCVDDENWKKVIKSNQFMLLELEMERQEKSGEGKCHQQVSIGNIHQLNWMNLMPPEKFIGVRQEIQDRKVFCDPSKGIPVQDIWMNYRDSVNQTQKTTGIPDRKIFDMLKDCNGVIKSR